jgi:hypothetical protein
MSVTRFAHVINPVRVGPASDLFMAQPITFESMRVAKERVNENVDVTFYAAFYPEDEEQIPGGFEKLRPLDRSILDVGKFKLKRKYPLISDILTRVAENAPEAEYLIYTNVDIALMPSFYNDLADLIAQGYDALTITRRTIPKIYTSPAELPRMYAEPGEPHPGHDCFILRQEALAQYDLGKVCIGAHWVGRAVELNQICTARRYGAFRDLHMTFHLGDDRPWRDERFKVFAKSNQGEIRRILLRFHSEKRLVDCPEVADLIKRFAPELLPANGASPRKQTRRSLWQWLRARVRPE